MKAQPLILCSQIKNTHLKELARVRQEDIPEDFAHKFTEVFSFLLTVPKKTSTTGYQRTSEDCLREA